MTVPLILLAIPSALIGWFTVTPMLFGGYFDGLHSRAARARGAEASSARNSTAPAPFSGRRSSGLPFWLAMAGVFAAWLFFYKKPALADSAERSFKWLHTILVNKYGFDWFNEHVIVPAAQGAGRRLVEGRR